MQRSRRAGEIECSKEGRMPSRKQHRRVEAHWPVLFERNLVVLALECAENEGWHVQPAMVTTAATPRALRIRSGPTGLVKGR